MLIKLPLNLKNIESVTRNILRFYLKLTTRRELKNWYQFISKVILNLFVS